MKVELKFTDECYADDKAGYDAFFQALQMMLNRMAMSHFKYQRNACPPTMAEATKAIDEVKSLQQRIAMYDATWTRQDILDSLEEVHKDQHTGNTENLLDAANMCVIEYLLPKHKKAHFRAQTLKESPGLAFRE